MNTSTPAGKPPTRNFALDAPVVPHIKSELLGRYEWAPMFRTQTVDDKAAFGESTTQRTTSSSLLIVPRDGVRPVMERSFLSLDMDEIQKRRDASLSVNLNNSRAIVKACERTASTRYAIDQLLQDIRNQKQETPMVMPWRIYDPLTSFSGAIIFKWSPTLFTRSRKRTRRRGPRVPVTLEDFWLPKAPDRNPVIPLLEKAFRVATETTYYGEEGTVRY